MVEIAQLATEEELLGITSVDAARAWAGLAEATWLALDEQLGGVTGTPGLRVLASLPRQQLHQQVATARASGRPLTAVEAAQVGLMWRVARQAVGLPDEDPGEAQRPAAAPPPPGHYASLAGGGDGRVEGVIAKLEGKLHEALAAKEQLEAQLQAANGKWRGAPATAAGAARSVAPAPPPHSSAELLWRRLKPVEEDALVLGISYAHGIGDFTKLVSLGTDCVTEVPQTRWNHNEIYHPDPNFGREKVYAKHGAFLSDMEAFDHDLFGMDEAEVKRTDPQQRKCLEAGLQAFQSAQIDRGVLRDKEMAVYVGVMTYDWLTMMSAQNSMSMLDGPHMLANRVSFMLGLMGPSLTIDTACSSSLVAASEAAGDVTAGRCSLSLALGVCYMGVRDTFFNRCAMRLLSSIGRSSSFNATADGYCRGEAYGGIVIGRYGDAWQGELLIAGSAVNEDGKSATMTAPNGPAQSQLMRNTHKVAGTMPAEMICMECAANGSALGDPIEFGAIRRVHGGHHLVLSSAKTGKGHTEGGSGMTGLIKSALMLSCKRVAPMVHIAVLNPNIDDDGSRAIFPDEGVMLPDGDVPQHAGVSAFGFGGTNAHAILAASSL